MSNLALDEKVQKPKQFRSVYHHKLAKPLPNWFAQGYPVNIVRSAREIMDLGTDVVINGMTHSFPSQFAVQSEEFLKGLDRLITQIISFVDQAIRNHFSAGLTLWRKNFQLLIGQFDDHWDRWEEVYLRELLRIHENALAPIELLVNIESQITEAEENGDTETQRAKQAQFISAVITFHKALFPPDEAEDSPRCTSPCDEDVEDSLSLAEACVFYEKRVGSRLADQAKMILKHYLDFRIFVTNIPANRVDPQHMNNSGFILFDTKLFETMLNKKKSKRGC